VTKKRVVVSFIILTLVTWIFISSVNTIVPIVTTTGSGSTGPSSGSGGAPPGSSANGTGTSTGSGTSSGINLSLSFPKVSLPNFHWNTAWLNSVISLLQPLFKFLLSILHLLISISAYIAKLFTWLLQLLHLPHSAANRFNAPVSHRTGSAGAAPEHLAGSSAFLPPVLLLYVVIPIVAALISGMAILGHRHRKPSSGADDRGEIQAINQESRSGEKKLLAGNSVSYRVVPLSGWRRGSEIMEPSIPDDLPLIYPANVPLGIRLLYPGSLEARGIQLTGGGINYTITLKEGCNEVSASAAGRRQKMFFRGVNTRREVSLLLRVNLLGSSLVEDSLTIREILFRREYPSAIKDEIKLRELTRMYEETFYGMKRMDIPRFQRYLYGLRDTFRDPVVVTCGG